MLISVTDLIKKSLGKFIQELTIDWKVLINKKLVPGGANFWSRLSKNHYYWDSLG